MRNKNDRLQVKVQAYFTVDIDLERVEEDPRWQMMNKEELTDTEKAKQQLFSYINQYILAGPKLLTNAPFTNSPSDVWVSKMEILDERSNATISDTDSN